jgi:Methyltransferase domain
MAHDPALWRDLDGLSIEVLFIDGDHHTACVVEDFESGSSGVAPGGFIVFDDYIGPECSPEGRPAVDLIVARIRQYRLCRQYDIVGCVPNVLGANPAQMSFNSTFVLRKLVGD